MTTDLMIPRVQVLGKFPQSTFETGDMLTYSCQNSDDFEYYQGVGGNISVKDVEECPLLFAPLPWYSHRAIEEMPEYLVCILPESKHILRVKEYIMPTHVLFVDHEIKQPIQWYKPATEAEYASFINQTK